MSTKQDLFGDEDAADHGFKVNEEFAKRFDHNKRREMLDRAKDKYGENLDLLDEASSSSSEDDSEAELINPRFEAKFFKLLTDIRKNNPQLKEEKEVFSDNDFEVSGDEEGAGEIADLLHEEVLRLGEVHGMDVRKRRVVAEHLNINGSDEQLTHLLLGHMFLQELVLESLGLARDDLVFFLLASGLANTLDKLKKFFREVTS